MIRGPMVTAGLVLALSAWCSDLAAQGDQRWEWSGGTGSFCVWYLGDPAIVGKLTGPQTSLRTASTMLESLPTQLRNVVRDEPRLGEWVPGIVCAGRYGAVQVDGRSVARADQGKALTFSLSAFAGTREGVPADWVIVDLGGSTSNLRRVAGRNGIAVKDRTVTARVVTEDEGDQWELRLGDARLFWQGAPGMAPRVASTRSMSFGYAGDRNWLWQVELREAGESERDAVGGLRIEGKGELAEALKTSPIRAMGPIVAGGTVELRFVRVPTDG